MTTQLPQILIRNSFNILGLSSSATLKEIRKRSQQLLQLAKIEEIPEFDTDIGHVKEIRNEGEIRTAVERLSGVQGRLTEIFFWLEDHSKESSKAITLISKGSYQEALDVLEKCEDVNATWLGRKNLALSLMFHAFAFSNLCSFCRSLDLWKLIAESEDFWKFYEKHYLLQDELGTSPFLFEEFRGSIFEPLSAKAASFYHQTKNPEAIGACFSAFGKVGKTIDTEILQPLILKVKNELEELEKMSDSDLDAPTIRRILKKIHGCFSELAKLGLSDYSPLAVLKNDITERLRSISVTIYNKNEDTETAQLFLDLGSKLATSEALLDKIEADKKMLSENEAWRSVAERFEEIKSLVEENKLDEAQSAYFRLDNDLAAEEVASSAENRIHLLIKYCSIVMEKGHELFGKKKLGIEILAISGFLNRKTQKKGMLAFEHVREVLKERLHLLDFMDPTSDTADHQLKTIDRILADLRNCELSSLFDKHESYLQTIEKVAHKHPNAKAQIVVSLFGIAACFSVLYRRTHWFMQRKMWKWIVCGSTIFFYLCVIMPNDRKSSSNPSHKSSSYQSRPTYPSSSQRLNPEEKDAIEWLDICRSDVLKTLRDKGYSDRQIAQAILEDMKEKGKSDFVEYFIGTEEKT
jgi:tetratricopeptide (TPR) repeat protein